MSQKTIPQSIFGDQTNIKRCVQPPGGTSSIVFGGESVKSEVAKGKNHQASDIFNLVENKEAKKPSKSQQEDTRSHVFGIGNVRMAEGDAATKSYNPITGELHQNTVAKEEQGHARKKDAESVRTTVSSATTTSTASTTTTSINAPAAMSSRGRQPPAGRSTNLW